MHVQTHQLQAMLLDRIQCGRQVGVPDTVLAVLPARVGLVAVAVAKAGVDAQPHRMAGRTRAQLVQHVDGACIHGHTVLHHAVERRGVEQVGGEDNLRRLSTRHIARRQRAQDLATRDGIHLHALLAHELEDVDVGAGLLRKTDGLEIGHLRNALADGGRVIHPQRGAKLVSQGPELGGGEGVGHGEAPKTEGVNDARMMPPSMYSVECFDLRHPFNMDMLCI